MAVSSTSVLFGLKFHGLCTTSVNRGGHNSQGIDSVLNWQQLEEIGNFGNRDICYFLKISSTTWQ